MRLLKNGMVRDTKDAKEIAALTELGYEPDGEGDDDSGETDGEDNGGRRKGKGAGKVDGA